jgi:hypothetical protein
VSRVGQTVFWDGIVTPATDWGAANTLHLLLNGDVPLEYRPAASSPLWTQPSAGGTASVQVRVGVSSAGNLQIRCNTASNTGGVYLSMVYRGAPL